MSQDATPLFATQQVNGVGKALVAAVTVGLDQEDAISAADAEILDNFRASHAYPAQNFYMTVKRHADKLGRAGGVAQRIKRMPSIVDKLLREPTMKLSQMQDIAGVRSVVNDLKELEVIRKSLEGAHWNHQHGTAKDYVTFPKASGYRSVHLKYKYVGSGAKAVYNGLRVEVQLRTKLQHQWATSVEAADAFTRQSLKQSRGNPAWERFFALMGSIFALKERCPVVPGTPANRIEIAREIVALNKEHHIASVFAGFAKLMPRIDGDRTNARYFLLMLDPVERRARIRAFQEDETRLAQAEYSLAEQRLGSNPLTQVVLVSASSIKALKRVYPNYFLDTAEFDKVVRATLADGK